MNLRLTLASVFCIVGLVACGSPDSSSSIESIKPSREESKGKPKAKATHPKTGSDKVGSVGALLDDGKFWYIMESKVALGGAEALCKKVDAQTVDYAMVRQAWAVGLANVAKSYDAGAAWTRDGKVVDLKSGQLVKTAVTSAQVFCRGEAPVEKLPEGKEPAKADGESEEDKDKSIDDKGDGFDSEDDAADGFDNEDEGDGGDEGDEGDVGDDEGDDGEAF